MKHALHPDAITVDSFETALAADDCVCDMAPCGCTGALDCTTATELAAG